ncbi:DUF202 domain-containing protein [Acidithiobacillus thiooxidans]|nr:DUF202 domain-containing protein [Acidithiobacillus albertensis]MBU2793214.1 DUF202 domain-containing protein [Acidithiobacillus thiooxidans]MBU2838756.1 DUF202 domain-containing protein [Acidithiobacillus thiooxidans]MBU2843184.1 DUF202 domain-containing protein [Acidithiobacillus thiooxidans]
MDKVKWLHALHIDDHRERLHKYRDSLILQDWLALDRTAAANKRTLYAFMRTTLDFNVSGLVFIRFFDYGWIMTVGWIFLGISVLLGGYGLTRYFEVKKHYWKFLRESPKPKVLNRF